MLVGHAEQADVPTRVEAGGQRGREAGRVLLEQVVLLAVHDLHADDPLADPVVVGEVVEHQRLAVGVVEPCDPVRAAADALRRGVGEQPVVQALHPPVPAGPDPGDDGRDLHGAEAELGQGAGQQRDRQPDADQLGLGDAVGEQGVDPAAGEPHVHVAQRRARPLEPGHRRERPVDVVGVGQRAGVGEAGLVQPQQGPALVAPARRGRREQRAGVPGHRVGGHAVVGQRGHVEAGVAHRPVGLLRQAGGVGLQGVVVQVGVDQPGAAGDPRLP
ncbi:hypothetical protein [Jannaschia sp. R86511]|uniref:hypothetical protein n=1 Tax=Jannaschia sp. R86511 TaxID=3093853 RepID=UPI0036D213FD